jgi:uncharacterized protein
MKLLLLFAIAAGLVLLAVWLGQRRLIYFPDRQVPDPRALGLADVEEARFSAEDGVRLHGWYAPARTAAGATPRDLAVLVSHGNAGNVLHRAYLLGHLATAGLHVLVYDYRGYGASDDVAPSEPGLYADGRAALAWLRERTGLPASRIVLYGESLGAAVAVELAASAPYALVLEAPFTSLSDVAAIHYPWLPTSLLLSDRYDSADKIGARMAPLLVVHGARDGIVPVAQGRTLSERAGGPATLVVVEGAGHNDLWHDAAARCRDLDAFLAGVAGVAGLPDAAGDANRAAGTSR